MVAAIEANKAVAYVPPWPWIPIAAALKTLPLPVAKKLF